MSLHNWRWRPIICSTGGPLPSCAVVRNCLSHHGTSGPWRPSCAHACFVIAGQLCTHVARPCSCRARVNRRAPSTSGQRCPSRSASRTWPMAADGELTSYACGVQFWSLLRSAPRAWPVAAADGVTCTPREHACSSGC